MFTIKQSLAQLSIVGAVLLASLLFFAGTVNAQSPYTGTAELTGYAWSSNIGWISMNCSNTSSCASDGGFDYEVTVEPTGALTGYAWSANIGWIKFGGLSAFPAAAGNAGGQARLVQSGSDYQVEGWARACAGTLNGDCSVMTNSAVSGGWDGWISLQGTNYGVVFNGDVISNLPSERFAWGGTVVGWIDFNPSFSPVIINPNPEITSFTATPDEVELGNTITLEWVIQGYDSCTASNNNGDSEWNGSVASANGSNTLVITPEQGSTIYSLECFVGGVADPAATVTVLARPDIEITAFSVSSLPPANPDGTYDNVQFLANVDSLPLGDSVDYDLTVGAQTQTGTLTQTATGNSFVPALLLSGITYGTEDIVLTVDLPSPGSVQENLPGTPANENIEGNTWTTTGFVFPPPPPTMSITASNEFVRSGDVATITWSIQAPYVAVCTVVGNGVDETVTTSGVFAIPTTGTATTPSLQSTASYLLTCPDPSGAAFTQELVVEVIPNYEEI